ncbi:hypothetical protein ACTMU2_11580 [Cupriavidus basilensis]
MKPAIQLIEQASEDHYDASQYRDEERQRVLARHRCEDPPASRSFLRSLWRFRRLVRVIDLASKR